MWFTSCYYQVHVHVALLVSPLISISISLDTQADNRRILCVQRLKAYIAADPAVSWCEGLSCHGSETVWHCSNIFKMTPHSTLTSALAKSNSGPSTSVQLALNNKKPNGCSIYWNTHHGPHKASGAPRSLVFSVLKLPLEATPKNIIYWSVYQISISSILLRFETCFFPQPPSPLNLIPDTYASMIQLNPARVRWNLAKLMARWEYAGAAPWELGSGVE